MIVYFIMKDYLKRIILDIKDITKNPIDNIYYIPDDENIHNGYAMIIGPEATPYQYGYYLFKFEFTNQYPYSPPIVTYHTNDGLIRFNPNFYRNGKVCLSILNTWQGEKWSSCQSIRSILITLQMTMNDNPLLNEPGIHTITHENQIRTYNDIIEYKNIELAIIRYLENDITIPNTFRIFYSTMVEKYKENKDDILQVIDQKLKMACCENRRFINIYNMSALCDYEALLVKIQKIKL